MPLDTYCHVCRTIAPCTSWRALLWCSRCLASRANDTPTCPEYHHDYHGGAWAWVCHTCGTTLGHTTITIPEEPTA